MTTSSKKAVKLPAQPYEPTPLEQRSVEAFRARAKEKPEVPRLKVVEVKNGAQQVIPDHPDLATGCVLLSEAIGSRDYDFLVCLLGQLANVGSKGPKVDELGANFMLSVVKGIEPRDQIEAMLAAQMAATHNAIMTFARRLAHVENIPQQDSAERTFNKLARTFTAQVEALKRYRSAGEQTVRVEHVTVNDGGQAIVGNVTHGGVAQKKPEATP